MRALFSAFLLLATASCASLEQPIDTPTGPAQGRIYGPYVVLGVLAENTSVYSDKGIYRREEYVSVEVPVGTEVIVPVVSGWTLGYGTTEPRDVSNGLSAKWDSEDHNFGVGHTRVEVMDIDAVAPNATFQSAVVRVQLRLADENGDDPWWGVLYYQLICLGRVH